jgi:dihydrofolate reductase
MILAADTNGGIGINNKMPWAHIADDMKHFQRTTNNNVVVMGANTWDSLGEIAPLKNRINYVITSKSLNNFPGVTDCYNYSEYSMENILVAIASRHANKEIIIIGGKTLYDATYHLCDTIYLTRVHAEFVCDTKVDINTYLQEFECRYEQIDIKKDQPPHIGIERWERV